MVFAVSVPVNKHFCQTLNVLKKHAESVDLLMTEGKIILYNSYLFKFEFGYTEMAVLKLPI